MFFQRASEKHPRETGEWGKSLNWVRGKTREGAEGTTSGRADKKRVKENQSH